jgi:hypothetical protein
MNLSFDPRDLRPLVEQVVIEAIERLEVARAQVGDRLAYDEHEAAALIGVRRHVLRDARLRGELVASRIGRRVIYRRDDIVQFLERNRIGR